MLLNISAQGLPFFKNISPSEYKAHKQNFDIEIDKKGTVYIANFEGLLYYDNAQWRMIFTPGITRVTVVMKDSKGKIWVGGYNFFGYVRVNERGNLELKKQDEEHEFQGEVLDIWETEGDIYFSVSNGKTYTAKQNSIFVSSVVREAPYDYSPIVSGISVNWKEPMDFGLTAVATEGAGVYIVDSNNNIIFHLDEESGLCSNSVQSLAYNQNGLLWGVTDNGIFIIQAPSPYTRFNADNGLRGEVLSLATVGQEMYAGTLNGLFRQKGQIFESVGNINYACWQIINYHGGLLAATSNGVYSIQGGVVKQLTNESTTAIMADPNGFYSGEQDGVYYNAQGKASVKVCEAGRVIKFIKDKRGVIWLQNLYGRIWNNESGTFVTQSKGKNTEEISTLVPVNNKPTIIPASATSPFPYPLFSYADGNGVLWLTNNKGKGLYALVNNSRNNEWTNFVYPLMDYNIRALIRQGDKVWMGSSTELIIADKSKTDPVKDVSHQVFIRSVVVNDDSVAWGGFNDLSGRMVFKSDERQILINYSTDYQSLLLPTQYRYRINGGRWSSWDFDTFTEYNNQPYGRYTFEVQARDTYGRISNTAKFDFEIEIPFYLRWYMILLYILLFALVIYATVLWRIHQLRKDKIQLEIIVRERTAEVVKQKNEIEEKSKSLETALSELGEAQHELVRQEKMATVGKLTQGLIDRILNPLNYINNFSKLSQGLVNDVTANIEDEKEHMDPEIYDDTIDVLGMLKGNLEKVSEHGANTTRTLKAMEEMLKDRTGGISQVDIIALIRQNEDMLGKYFEKEISGHYIKIAFNYPNSAVKVNGNPEQLSKTFMSLLSNAIYAVVKKAQRKEYAPEVDLTITPNEQEVEILIRDNGIGIEDTIIHKIFDPFFTTKTTGEASGVGLYLSREIIQNYGGDITVKSQKDEYTEFSIILPTLK
jgi:signal transduction histidine kinase